MKRPRQSQQIPNDVHCSATHHRDPHQRTPELHSDGLFSIINRRRAQRRKKKKKFPKLACPSKTPLSNLPVKTSQVKTDTHDFLQQHTQTPSPCGATPPYPGAGRETHRKILPRVDGFSTTSRTSPTEKGGSMCREGGGKGSPGVITLMNPGPYRPLYLWGWLVGRGQRTAPCQGGVPATRWSPASLGTVR